MTNSTLPAPARIRADIVNISDTVEQEIGYVKSILHAIGVLARQDSEMHLPEIIRLTECAYFMCENFEGNVDHIGEKILLAVDELPQR